MTNALTFTMTEEYKKRTRKAISETELLLKKEMSYSVDLQKKDKIEYYQTHIQKLKNLLNK